MPADNKNWVQDTNLLLRSMALDNSLDSRLVSGISLASRIIGLLTEEPVPETGVILGDSILTLPNSERFDAWFRGHPDFEGTKSAFTILDGTSPGVQAKFYWLKKKSNALIAGAVHFTPNWEDEPWSRNNNYKIGIDFFLSPDGSSLFIAVSNLGKLRVLELREKLTNTDIEILQKWLNVRQSVDLAEIHGVIWDSFKLQSVNAKFYQGIADLFNELQGHLVLNGLPAQDAKMFSSRLLGRLIFVWFLKQMGHTAEEQKYFESSGLDQGIYYQEKLEFLFFKVLNMPADSRSANLYSEIDNHTPYLNGGLFSPKPDDSIGQARTFPNEFFTRVYLHFENFNFTTDESTPDYEQVAIDPEMLGRVFESLLASQIESTGEQARKAKGAFYTPREVVAYMCKEAVRNYLHTAEDPHPKFVSSVDLLLDKSDQDWVNSGTNSLRDIPKEVRESILRRLVNLKSLDPACGSGAFPLGLLNLLVTLHTRLNQAADPYKVKLSILQNNIFGSDIEPMAIEISRLRSWLSLIVEKDGTSEIEPLPNLDFNFVCANSLVELQEADLYTDDSVQLGLEKLRKSYFSERDPLKKTDLQKKFKKILEPELFDERSNQLRSFNPFNSDFPADFFDPEVMFGVSDGFDLVIGNPPYIDYRKIPAGSKNAIKSYKVANHSKMINFYLYFFELGFNLLKKNGILAYISPQQYLIYENTKGLRDLIREMSIISLSDFARVKVFDAATYTFVSIISKTKSNTPGLYLDFDQMDNLALPIRTKDIANPISEPVSISEFSDLVGSIETSSHLKLSDLADIFCASSETVALSATPSGFRFLAASDIFRWRIAAKDVYVDSTKYSKNSAEKQGLGPIVYTSRMTTNIRACVAEPKVYLGGKVNVLVPKKQGLEHFIAAILNSALINFWYRQKFSMQHMQGNALPINTTELANIPISGDEDLWRAIGDLAAKSSQVEGQELSDLEQSLDELIFKLFGVVDKDVTSILQSLKT